jgi:hypothetical protein
MASGDNQNKAPSRSIEKRGLSMLVAGVLVLYGFIFAFIYIWKSGTDVTALFFDNSAASMPVSDNVSADNAPIDETAVGSVGLAESQDDEILPPLDDGTPFSSENDLPPLFPIHQQTPIPSTWFIDASAEPVPGVSFTSVLLPIKCWDDRGFEFGAEECDEPGQLAKFATLRLADWEQCRTEVSSEANLGSITVFAEADFVRNRFSIWPGTTSTIRSADRIAECVTSRWHSFPLSALSHRYNRYRMKGAVRFDAVRRNQSVAAASLVTPGKTDELLKAAASAQEVTVARDRVRVRKSPVDGEIIGFISTGQKVKLIQVTDDWCLIKTGKGNIGWMICWGLDLAPKTPAAPLTPIVPKAEVTASPSK